MKRIIIGALIGASVLPAVFLIAGVISLLFDMELDKATAFASMGVGLTFMGVFFAKMTE